VDCGKIKDTREIQTVEIEFLCRIAGYTYTDHHKNTEQGKIKVFGPNYKNTGATGWIIGGLECRRGLGIFLFTSVSRPALRAILPPIQWLLGALSLGAKRPGR